MTMSEQQPAAAPSTTQPNQPDGAWPSGMPYTLVFPDGDGYLDAELEHPAPLPRVGDVVEYIDETGGRRLYRVREVMHTIQSSAARRPHVEDAPASPQSLARVQGEGSEKPGQSGLVRAGLPQVFLEEAGG
jgi:hypothetical protein